MKKFDATVASAPESEAVATVLSSRVGNDTSTIDKALPGGTKLYTRLASPQVQTAPDVASAPGEVVRLRNALESAARDCPQCEGSGSYRHKARDVPCEYCEVARAALAAPPATDEQVEVMASAYATEFYGPGFDPHLNPEAYDMAERATRAAIAALSTPRQSGEQA